jgi:mono/diheme cytochrome c family protein
LPRVFAATLLATLLLVPAAARPTDAGEDQPVPEFTEAFLNDPANIELGRKVWQEQCRHCHGKDAYPGKAPKLKPQRYTPEFVYHRVTYGFRGMPSWQDVYSEEERMAVVAWVLSKAFSP